MRWSLWVMVAVGIVLLVLVGTGTVPGVYVFGPLLGFFIYQVGVASLASFRHGAAHVPDGPPVPVDARQERTTYWCAGCGAELLLLVRGAQVPPRHCGERMVERREVTPERS